MLRFPTALTFDVDMFTTDLAELSHLIDGLLTAKDQQALSDQQVHVVLQRLHLIAEIYRSQS